MALTPEQKVMKGNLVATLRDWIKGKLDLKADKTATVSNVAYDTTTGKITKTINGTTTDVVTVPSVPIPISDVTGLETALEGKAASSHQHTTSDITNFPSIPDVAAALNRSTNVNVADTNYSTVMARGIYAGTADLKAGTSALTSGVIYLVYE